MPAGAKINNTLNGGYFMPEDFDAAKLQRFGRIRQREEEDRLRAKGLDEKSKRVTFMMPYTVVCNSCEKHIAKGTKLYVNVSKAAEKYLGTVPIHQLLLRCPMPGCNNMIKLITNPKTRSYDVSSGGKGLGIPTEAELLERIKMEDEMKKANKKVDGSSGGGSAKNNFGGHDETSGVDDGLASFEEMQQKIMEDSARLEALGDTYMDERSQVERIQQARLRQQQNDDAAEKLSEDEERRLLHEEFLAARRQQRALLNQSEKISSFGNSDFLERGEDQVDDENNNNNGDENNNNAKKAENENKNKQLKIKVAQQLNNSFADAIALLSTFENNNNNAKTVSTKSVASKTDIQNASLPSAKPKSTLLSSMFGNDDADEDDLEY